MIALIFYSLKALAPGLPLTYTHSGFFVSFVLARCMCGYLQRASVMLVAVSVLDAICTLRRNKILLCNKDKSKVNITTPQTLDWTTFFCLPAHKRKRKKTCLMFFPPYYLLIVQIIKKPTNMILIVLLLNLVE